MTRSAYFSMAAICFRDDYLGERVSPERTCYVYSFSQFSRARSRRLFGFSISCTGGDKRKNNARAVDPGNKSITCRGILRPLEWKPHKAGRFCPFRSSIGLLMVRAFAHSLARWSISLRPLVHPINANVCS